MQHHVPFFMPARRTVAALATISIAALAVITTAPTARADASDANISVGPVSVSLAIDLNGNGIPEPLDTVKVDVPVTALNGDILVSNAQFGGSGGAASHPTVTPIADGATATVPFFHIVGLSDVGTLGTAPVFPTLKLTYWKGFSKRTLDVPAPAPLYTAPSEPLSFATTYDIVESAGSVPGAVVEGDTVGYTTTVTNVSAVWVRIDTMPGYDDFAGPVWLEPGGDVTVHRSPVTVTYDDMVAGSVAFPGSTVTWGAGYTVITLLWSGSSTASYTPVPTEAIDASVSVDVTAAVRDTSGAPVALGAAAPGDVIDYTFALANNGNVTMNYVSLETGPGWPLGAPTTTFTLEPSDVRAGTSLPTGAWGSASITSEGAGAFTEYALTAADVARGYVDLEWVIKAAPNSTVFAANPSASTHTVTKRVFLKDFTTKGNLKFTKAELNDTNGDGIGQAGETVSYRVRFKNNADQPLEITAAGDAAGTDAGAPIGTKFIGKVLGQGETVAKAWTYTITATDEARGTLDVGAAVDYTGQIDWATDSRTAWAGTIPTGPYVAPPSTLTTGATYDDTNGDGFPSIGETVHVTVTVANAGTYPLTGLVVTDAAGSDVSGMLPVIASTVAGPGSESVTFDYVLTAADFARGTLAYSTEMTADGLATTASSTSVNLTDITFAAYATDLDGKLPGGISVCLADGTPSSTIVISTTISVVPGGACGYAGLPAGYRVVAFSTPMVMGTDTFSVFVPGALGVGPHRLALYAPGGTLVGYQDVTVKDPIAFSGPDMARGGALASTGTDRGQVTWLAGGAAALVLLGTGVLVAGSRRRPAGEAR